MHIENENDGLAGGVCQFYRVAGLGDAPGTLQGFVDKIARLYYSEEEEYDDFAEGAFATFVEDAPWKLITLVTNGMPYNTVAFNHMAELKKRFKSRIKKIVTTRPTDKGGDLTMWAIRLDHLAYIRRKLNKETANG